MYSTVLHATTCVHVPLVAGCSHFIIGRDMAGSKSSLTGKDFYGAYDAQEMANKHAAELGMQTVPSLNIAYTQEKGYVTADIAEKENLTKLNLSGESKRNKTWRHAVAGAEVRLRRCRKLIHMNITACFLPSI